MDAKLTFWTYALILMTAMITMGLVGWRQIRRNDIRRHRRSMQIAIALFFTFIASYLLKLRFLGREDFDRWSAADITVLRIHETFVLLLFLCGLAARWLAHRMETSTANRQVIARRHRLAGRTALISGILALLTAGVVLLSMFRRSSELTAVWHPSHTARGAIASLR